MIEPSGGVRYGRIACVDREGWLKEVADIRENHYLKFGDKLPPELADMLDEWRRI